MTHIVCDCSVTDYDPPRVYIDRVVTARKPHKCCECGREIRPGQKYEYVWGIWDGDRNTYKTCWTCLNIRETYCPFGHLFGGLAETLHECLGFDYRFPVVDDEDEEEDMA